MTMRRAPPRARPPRSCAAARCPRRHAHDPPHLGPPRSRPSARRARGRGPRRGPGARGGGRPADPRGGQADAPARLGRHDPGLARAGARLRRPGGDASDPIVRAMNLVGYDAMAVGNHEFDFGLERLERSRREARFPWLSANTSDADGEPALPPYAVLEVGGVRVGILGLVTPHVAQLGEPAPDRGAAVRRLRRGGRADYVPSPAREGAVRPRRRPRRTRASSGISTTGEERGRPRREPGVRARDRGARGSTSCWRATRTRSSPRGGSAGPGSRSRAAGATR